MLKEGGSEMDELYTVDEMTDRLKVSRETLYAWMKAGIIPYVQIGGKRRFMASQITKALKMLQNRQSQEAFFKGRNYTLSDETGVRKDTLSALRKSSSNRNRVKHKPRIKLKKRQYKHSQSGKSVRKRQAVSV